MAPSGQSKATSTKEEDFDVISKELQYDAMWYDIDVDKLEEQDSTVQTDPVPSGRPSPVIPPLPAPGHLRPTFQTHPPPPSFPVNPMSVLAHDPYGSPSPTAQQNLETQLLRIAEVSLGTLNAVHILESHLWSNNPSSPKTTQIDVNVIKPACYTPNGMYHYDSSPQAGIQPSYFYQIERPNHSQMIRNMGYLLGLKRAIKLLRDAVADTEREDCTYVLKERPSPPPLPPPQPMTMPPQLNPFGLPHPGPSTPEKELRLAAKDIVKDTVREYKDTVVNPGVEEVQKEMIKLLRDVCRDALAVDKHH